MLKQTIMESYVDECLDEVEIREVFITEGFLDKLPLHFVKALKDKASQKIIEYPDTHADKQLNQEIKYAKETLNKIKTELGMNDVISSSSSLYSIVGTIAVISLIAYGSYKLYKRFMSKAAKACKDKKGKDKTICMNQYQIKALEASKKPLMDGAKGCSKAKDVQGCRNKFKQKINKVTSKINKKQKQIKILIIKKGK